MELISMGSTRPKAGGTPAGREEQHTGIYLIQFRTKEDNRKGIDAASELGDVTQRKVGNQTVTVVSGEQLAELDELEIKYEHYVPPRSSNPPGYG